MFEKMKKRIVYSFVKGYVKGYMNAAERMKPEEFAKFMTDMKYFNDWLWNHKDPVLRKVGVSILGIEMGYAIAYGNKIIKEVEKFNYEQFIKERWCEN